MSPSDPTLESRALALLDEALEQPADGRVAWAESRTADDPQLRRRLLTLIGAAGREGSLHTGGAAAEAEETPPPERIGAYRIGERLGQGGMGAVYRAERDAGDFKHTVAIKVIRPGALSEALIERFQRERQTLADLPHPNIARLYDGGETAEGQPYIVMEHVAGRPITAWARERGLDARARLELFLQACEGVRFAHQNLIVHRDLTPSNVLVTDDGAVKLIDFGIARPQELEAVGGFRDATAGLSLTPGFAAPERLAGAGATTLVDIYSLGRLLQELLEGLPADADLQAIAAKAAAERPEDRYPSVDALIEDARSYLSGRTVAARSGGRRYALGKFIGRHRRAVAASTLALGLLVGAFAVTLVAYGAANRARAAEARRFEELRSLAGYMIFDLNGRLARVAGNTQARVTLAARAQRYLSALAATARADEALKREAARGFIALAYVQGVPGQPNLGQVEQARANLARALGMLNGAGASADRAEALAGLAMVSGNVDTDQKSADRRVAQAEAALNAAPAAERDASWHAARSRVRRTQLDMAVLGQRPELMQGLADRLVREIGEWPAPMRASRQAEFDRAYADQNRSIHGYFTDHLDEAVGFARQAERRLVALDAALPNDPEVLYALAWNSYIAFGAASGAPGQQAEAERLLALAQRTIERLLRLEENDHSLRSFAGQIGQARAQALSAAGRRREAASAQAEVVRLYDSSLGPERRPGTLNRLANAVVTVGKIAAEGGDRPLACSSFTRARSLIEELDRRKALIGSVGGYRATLDTNIALCARGAPLSQMAVFK